MAITVIGPVKKSCRRSQGNHREYQITHRVRTSATTVGPAEILADGGLPQTGDAWSFDGDSDAWAFCTPQKDVAPIIPREGEPTYYWLVTSYFSTVPMSRCMDDSIEDPLLEPQKVSGTFVRYRKEVGEDRNGNRLQTSSLEPLRGPEVEFDLAYPTVRIEQNVGSLELSTIAGMVNTVNNATLWGMAARKVLLTNFTWSRKVYGVCDYYYTRVFDFEINAGGWDRTVDDIGTMALRGEWNAQGTWTLIGNPDKTNPNDFIKVKDRNGEILEQVGLDGDGEPATSAANIATIDIDYYGESNFLLLGIPTGF